MQRNQSYRLAVIIPVFNSLHFTKKCLATLYKQFEQIEKNVNIMIILFNDGSTDGTPEWVKNHYPEVIILNGDGSNWWSRSVNKCTEYVLKEDIADYIIWWNNDIEPFDDYFEKVISLLPEIGDHTVAGSKIYVKGTNLVWGMGGYFNKINGNKYHNAYMVEDCEKYDKITSVDWLPGMGTIAHTSIHSKVGPIDADKFPQYHGDIDFTLSAKLANYDINVFPQLRIYNDISNTGVKLKRSWTEMFQTMRSIKSLYNFKIDILLYKKYTKVPFSYLSLITKYGKFIGGFIKNKLIQAISSNR